MSRFTTQTEMANIGLLSAKVTSDVYKGEKYDTEIELSSGIICTIDGNKTEQFITAINNIINEYSI